MQGSAPISAGITTIQKARDECVASIATLTAAHSSEIVTLWKKVDRLDQAARAGMTILLEDDNVDDWFAVAASVNVTMRYLRLKSIDQMVEEMLNSHPTDPPSSSLSMPLLTFGLTVSFFKAVACDPYEKYIRVLRSFTTNDAAVVEAQQVFGIRLTAMELFDQYDVSFLKVGDVEKDATDVCCIRDLTTNLRHALAHANFEASADYQLITLRNKTNFEVCITVDGFWRLGMLAFTCFSNKLRGIFS